MSQGSPLRMKMGRMREPLQCEVGCLSGATSPLGVWLECLQAPLTVAPREGKARKGES